ncbi:hypothetical protein K7W03_14530 [Sphingobium sp. PNB]|uniref:hypothetical protein n=1 Tax=Sphingobium sp. PNB TaxID=863934 RepID=UPI001CA41737|nr:hypothetical protein [Sphingobium sp. PNB]MCB4860808.1 hypothetical protein [Sphingobium sp. PNB]
MMDGKEQVSRLTTSQRAALIKMFKIGNNPYGWAAADIGAAGRTMASLEQAGYLVGGNMYGSKQRTYRYSDKAIRIRAALIEQQQ